MPFVSCDGTLSTGAGGEVLCSGSWVGVDSPVFYFAELSTASIAALLSAAIVTMAIAYGLRLLRRMMGY